MKSGPLQELVEIADGLGKYNEIHRALARSRPKNLLIGFMAGAVVAIGAAYFLDNNRGEKFHNPFVVTAEIVSSAKNVPENELNRLKDAENNYKNTIAEKDGWIAGANIKIKEYQQKVTELEKSVKTLTVSLDAQKGSEKDVAIANLTARVLNSEKQAKASSEAEDYKKLSNTYAEQARQKNTQISGLEKQVNDFKKQASSLADEGKKYRELLEAEKIKSVILSQKLVEYGVIQKKVAEISLKLEKMKQAGNLVYVKAQYGNDELLPERELSAYNDLLDRISSHSTAFFGASYEGSYVMRPEKDCFEQLPYNHIKEIRITGGPGLGRASGSVLLADLGSKLPFVEVLHIENACIDTAFGFENFAAVRELNLVNCNVDCVSGFERLKNLKELVLAGNVGIWNTEENAKYLDILAKKGVEVIIEGEHYHNWLARKK
jgi:hypothetical protein